MTQTEQGEFELVLGNKQLLSVFFIVVVLLAVFFFMGYVVGRNSGPTTLARVNTGTTGVATASSRPSPMPQAPAPTPAAQAPPSESQATSPEPPASAPAPTQPPAAPPAETAANTQEQPASPQSIGEPPAGTTWLQVVATTRPDAQLIAETLNRRHFRTQVAPGPNGLFRVLVGPAKNSAEASQLRTKLEADGFRNPMVRKY